MAVLEDEPDHGLGDNDLIEPGNVRMDKLSMVVDLAGEVGVVLLGGLEHNLGAIGEFVGGQIDFAERALSNEAAEGVVAHGLEVLVGEFAVLLA